MKPWFAIYLPPPAGGDSLPDPPSTACGRVRTNWDAPELADICEPLLSDFNNNMWVVGQTSGFTAQVVSYYYELADPPTVPGPGYWQFLIVKSWNTIDPIASEDLYVWDPDVDPMPVAITCFDPAVTWGTTSEVGNLWFPFVDCTTGNAPQLQTHYTGTGSQGGGTESAVGVGLTRTYKYSLTSGDWEPVTQRIIGTVSGASGIVQDEDSVTQMITVKEMEPGPSGRYFLHGELCLVGAVSFTLANPNQETEIDTL